MPEEKMALFKKPDVFPEGRYKLLLIDQLLDEPFSFDLSKPVVTVGLSEDADCVIPVDTMGLTRLLPLMPREMLAKHLMKLCYDFDAEKWNVEDAMPDPDYSAWIPIPASSDDSMDDVSEPMSPDFSEGDFVEVHLPQGWGAFLVKLVDTDELQLEASDLEAQDEDTGIPGFEKTMLSKLPHIPMRIIARLVGPDSHCFDQMCRADPYIVPKLISGVELTTMHFFKSCCKTNRVLDCFRWLRMLSQDSLKVLEVTSEKTVPSWLFSGIEFTQEVHDVIMAEVVTKLFAGTGLEKLNVPVAELTMVSCVSERLKRLEVDAQSSLMNPNLVWTKLASLRMPPTVEVRVFFDHEQNVTAINEEPTTVLVNVTEVSWQGCSFCLFPPLALLPNLKELALGSSYDNLFSLRLVSTLTRAKLPLLSKVTVAACANSMALILAAFAMAAPNLEKISWSSSGSCFCCNLEVAALVAVPMIKMFHNLKTFCIRFGNFSYDEDAAVAFFKELAHVPSVKVSSLLTSGSQEQLRRKFSELEQLGKVVDIEDDHERSDKSDADEDDSAGSGGDFEEESITDEDVDLQEGSVEESGQNFCGEDQENIPGKGENEEEDDDSSSSSKDEAGGKRSEKDMLPFAEEQEDTPSSGGNEEEKSSSTISGNIGEESISGGDDDMPGYGASEGEDTASGSGEDDDRNSDFDDDSSDDGKPRVFNVIVRDPDFHEKHEDDEYLIFFWRKLFSLH